MNIQQMIATHPDVHGSVNPPLVRCIEHCYSCAEICTSCADACLGEDMVNELRQCIRLNLDCADVCNAAGTLASRRTGSNPDLLLQILDVCMTACGLCGDECERHAQQHEHCRLCADACRQCEQACEEAMESMGLSDGLGH